MSRSSRLDPHELVGSTFHERYFLEGFVGFGRFSTLYRGTEAETNRPVAVRLFHARDTLPPSRGAMVLESLRAAFPPAADLPSEADLPATSATIASVLGVGAIVADEGYWMPGVAQSLVVGDSLQSVVTRERMTPIPLARAIESMTPLADALTGAHASGRVHGSLAPQSVVLSHGVAVQLLDFGMTAALTALQAKYGAFALATERAPLFFDSAYGSPEQFSSARSQEVRGLTPASDVFSLALLVLERVTGRTLGDDDARREAAALDPAVRPTPRGRGRDLGPYIEAVFERALAVRAIDRYSTIESFWSALRAASRLMVRPTRTIVPPPLPPPIKPVPVEAIASRPPPAPLPSSGSMPTAHAARGEGPSLGASERAPRISGIAEDESADDLVVGEVIAGKYSVDRLLGRGGMGTVWLCTHLGLGERVALKVLSRTMADDDEVRTRFEREARASAKIKSRYVVRVHDTGTLPDRRPYFVMEYMEGETLGDALKGGASLPLGDVVRILGQVGRGLARVHALGIIHRDVKPENVFLAQTADDGVIAKIFDFGIVKVPDAGDSETRAGMLVGTPHYMSPEQADGLAIDERSDIYSIGVLAFRMLTGKRPFLGDSVLHVLVKVCTAPLPRLIDHAPSVPAEVDEWFRRTCARRPSDRFDSAIECVNALARAAGVEVSRDASLLPPPPSADPARATNPLFDAVERSIPPAALDATVAAPRRRSRGRWARRFAGAVALGGLATAVAVSAVAYKHGDLRVVSFARGIVAPAPALPMFESRELASAPVAPTPIAVPAPPPTAAATLTASRASDPLEAPDAGASAAPGGGQARPHAGRSRRAASTLAK